MAEGEPPVVVEEERVENQIELGPLKIRALAVWPVVSELVLDLVRGTPRPSPRDEPKIEVEIKFGNLVDRINQSRWIVSNIILVWFRGYPEIAEKLRELGPAAGELGPIAKTLADLEPAAEKLEPIVEQLRSLAPTAVELGRIADRIRELREAGGGEGKGP
jgi:hypothetical protein